MVGGVGEMSLDDDADPVPGGRALGEGGETCGDGVLKASASRAVTATA